MAKVRIFRPFTDEMKKKASKFRLSQGAASADETNRQKKVCIMQLISIITGQVQTKEDGSLKDSATDHPVCVSPVICRIAIEINDALPTTSNGLLPRSFRRVIEDLQGTAPICEIITKNGSKRQRTDVSDPAFKEAEDKRREIIRQEINENGEWWVNRNKMPSMRKVNSFLRKLAQVGKFNYPEEETGGS